jgi:hypothetical protein
MPRLPTLAPSPRRRSAATTRRRPVVERGAVLVGEVAAGSATEHGVSRFALEPTCYDLFDMRRYAERRAWHAPRREFGDVREAFEVAAQSLPQRRQVRGLGPAESRRGLQRGRHQGRQPADRQVPWREAVTKRPTRFIDRGDERQYVPHILGRQWLLRLRQPGSQPSRERSRTWRKQRK